MTSSFDSFLEEAGIKDEVEAVAIKRVLAWQLERAMKVQQKTKQAMAKELRTSRSQLDRLLDPRNVSVSLDTITRAARALGKRVVIRIADVKAKRVYQYKGSMARFVHVAGAGTACRAPTEEGAKFKRAGKMPFVPQDEPALQGRMQRRDSKALAGRPVVCKAKAELQIPLCAPFLRQGKRDDNR
jgi:antitoxin HicB